MLNLKLALRRLARTPLFTDIEVVGLVKNSKYADLRAAPPRMFYLLYNQQKRQDDLSFYVRTATDPEATGSSIRQVVASLDSNLPLLAAYLPFKRASAVDPMAALRHE